MSARVLARHYRPRRFSELVGQEHVTQALGHALATGRLHHAYLFTGTRGVGKTTVSRILAKALNCQGPDGQGGVTAEPCGVCAACRDIDAGRFVDYVELDAASNRGVEEISQLLDQAVYKPVVGRTKVYMIDEVHMLSTHAFNAMLKTLEEPPEYLKFVLATTDPQKVPVTVLSRCLQFNLRPLPPALVAQHLGTVLGAEGIASEAGALRLLGRAARGSMRDALSLTDQAIAYGGGQVAESQVLAMLGSTPRAQALQLLEALAGGDALALVQGVDGLRSAGHHAPGALDELARWLQLIALAQAAPQALDGQDPDTPEAQRLAEAWPADLLQLAYSLLLQGRAELPLSADEHAGLLMLLLRVLAFRPAGDGPAPSAAAFKRSELAARLNVPVPAAAAQAPAPAASAPAVTAHRPVEPITPVQPVRVPEPVSPALPTRPVAPRPSPPPAAPQSAAPVPAGSAQDEPPPWVDLPPQDEEGPSAAMEAELPVDLDRAAPALDGAPAAPAPAALQRSAAGDGAPALVPTPLGAAWAALVADLPITALARTLALQAQCLRLEQESLPWVVHLQVTTEALGMAPGPAKLEAALAEKAGGVVQLTVGVGPVQDSPALRDAAAKAERQRQAESDVAESPEFAALKRHFETARIVPGSVRPLDS
ncbi:DNA polymerase III subunit gamma/tau [Inhella gelatinilytica]|uniref:DNA polymerase III subunit gamma/tau n=1 Tax=Inhella gelatinilytica TaxID=2795030 RepID=A0A931IYY6_9BURK|nr:DNA polymerase III subunit gamma/tau [Inhella gelatinilytica]MBH9552563.1 DNA polymerase III subunit gamma/tau [Inhella gelatinilytica]